MPCAGKTFSFNMTDLTEFFREIHKAEYFDSILARLSIKDLQKITIQFEDQMKEILTGQKCDCWRHKFFLYGSCEEYPNQSKLHLINFDKLAGFSNDQTKMMISFLQRITEDHDYALQVLLPEFIELLLVNIFTISKEEARQYMLDGGNSYHGRILPDLQSVWKGTLLLRRIKYKKNFL